MEVKMWFFKTKLEFLWMVESNILQQIVLELNELKAGPIYRMLPK